MFVFEFNTELVGDVAPDSFEDLQAWIHENPGLFTYPAVPDFTGSVFLRHLFYWAAGGSEAFAGPFDQEVFDQYAPTVWEYLNDIGPSLWRGGDTYPTEAAVQSGDTIMLAGLITDTATDGSSGIPGLSRIPVVGALFGQKSRTSRRSEVIVLLTPSIVRNSQEARNLTDEYSQRFRAMEPLNQPRAKK